MVYKIIVVFLRKNLCSKLINKDEYNLILIHDKIMNNFNIYIIYYSTYSLSAFDVIHRWKTRFYKKY